MVYHSLNPNIILGYHGCDEPVGLNLLSGKDTFRSSNNDYDWLGPGIYFWESNPERALSFAIEQKKRGRIQKPFVIGAALTLGNCIDTLNERSIEGLRSAYKKLADYHRKSGVPLPKNTGGADRLFKKLDCAVVLTLHEMLKEKRMPKADSVRGLYYEGKRLYPRSAFYEKSHIQICICNPQCIKGVFRHEIS